jgi:hypothetical protein
VKSFPAKEGSCWQDPRVNAALQGSTTPPHLFLAQTEPFSCGDAELLLNQGQCR